MADKVPAYKTFKFWAITALTLGGLTVASEAFVDVPAVGQALAWIATLGGALGFRGWGPQDGSQPTE